MSIWRVEPSPSQSPRTISTLIFTRQLGISLANSSIHKASLARLRPKMCKMDASVANLWCKLCASDDIPIGCLIVRCHFIIEITQVRCDWLVRQIKCQLIHLLSTENCAYRILMWSRGNEWSPRDQFWLPPDIFWCYDDLHNLKLSLEK